MEKDEDIQLWLSQMQDYLDLSDADWKEWVPIAVIFLRGAAYEWYLAEVRRHNKPSALSHWMEFETFCLMSVGIGLSRTDGRRSIGLTTIYY